MGEQKMYQVYLNGNWYADCETYEDAETIANMLANEGEISIERTAGLSKD